MFSIEIFLKLLCYFLSLFFVFFSKVVIYNISLQHFFVSPEKTKLKSFFQHKRKELRLTLSNDKKTQVLKNNVLLHADGYLNYYLTSQAGPDTAREK